MPCVIMIDGEPIIAETRAAAEAYILSGKFWGISGERVTIDWQPGLRHWILLDGQSVGWLHEHAFKVD